MSLHSRLSLAASKFQAIAESRRAGISLLHELVLVALLFSSETAARHLVGSFKRHVICVDSPFSELENPIYPSEIIKLDSGLARQGAFGWWNGNVMQGNVPLLRNGNVRYGNPFRRLVGGMESNIPSTIPTLMFGKVRKVMPNMAKIPTIPSHALSSNTDKPSFTYPTKTRNPSLPIAQSLTLVDDWKIRSEIPLFQTSRRSHNTHRNADDPTIRSHMPFLSQSRQTLAPLTVIDDQEGFEIPSHSPRGLLGL
ncbi:hypothetical protein L1049_019585 [Liquidambar formosana]|uniref:Uncharacterized protein n=1 Tax=Liquidambar formosana TaxID=63359 RepID=A0AAP0S635_LIQFO